MRRPFDQAHRIPFGLQQCRQIPLQARIRHRCLLPPTPGLADPPLRSDSFSREFFDPSLDRLPIRSRARCYLTDTTRADLERFCSQIQAPLLLIQFVPQDLVLLLCRHSLTIPYFPVFWKLFADEPLVVLFSCSTYSLPRWKNAPPGAKSLLPLKCDKVKLVIRWMLRCVISYSLNSCSLRNC